jgi:hypothetical protein
VGMTMIGKETFNIIQKAARLWHEAGRQEEALLYSQMKQVADQINALQEERDKKLFAEQPFESVAQMTERLRIKRLAEEL